MFDSAEKEQIRKFLKADNIDMRHLNDIKSSFLSCESTRLGFIPKKAFLSTIYSMNLKFPEKFFLSLLEMIKEKKDDEGDEEVLSYQRLKGIIEIYI